MAVHFLKGNYETLFFNYCRNNDAGYDACLFAGG
jgi:hypothetical protein